MTRAMTALTTGCLLLALLAPAATAQEDHPFTLVNVIDLYGLFSSSVEFDMTFDPSSGVGPSNWDEYKANPRVGTNPSCVAVYGGRAWIGGFYGGPEYFGGDPNEQRLSYYASVGIAEVQNIYWASGYGDPSPFVRYNNPGNPSDFGTFDVGSGVTYSDYFSSVDYDPATKTLYAAFHDQTDIPGILLPPGTVQQQTYIAALDVDPNSVGYGQFRTGWPIENPLTGSNSEESKAGIEVDPLDPFYLSYFAWGSGRIKYFDVSDMGAAPIEIYIWDQEMLSCNSTAYRSHNYDPVTGDIFIRVGNAVQWVPRDTRTSMAPFEKFPRFIRENPEGTGDLTANTIAAGDDEQLVEAGEPAAAGQNIIGVGDNGILDTMPMGDDLYNINTLVTSRPVGNNIGACNDDPTGLPFGTAQGQGVAFINAYNLAGLEQDVLLINSRPYAGSGNLGDLRFFTLDGEEYATLELPCTPPAGPEPLGIAWYDMDYDPDTGTLVVLEFEQRKLYVFRAELVDGPAYPHFDYTRNGETNLRDFAYFQRCFTGPEEQGGGPIGLACQRLNANTDCDIDYDDWLEMSLYWDTSAGL